MTEVRISVSRYEREGLLSSTVWCLVRPRAYGGPGDAFRVGDTWFAITGTELRPWTRIRDEYFRECGFDSPREFQERYRADISSGRTFNPSIQEVVHWVDRIRYSGFAPIIVPGIPFTVVKPPPTKKLLIRNSPEWLGMDALAYCMGIQCPLKNGCKRNINEAARYPHEVQVKVLPTTPYNKIKGDCDYFIRK